MRREYRFSGFGGQGVLTLGTILGLAATVYDNQHACQTQSYGPESRGGTSCSEVVVSDQEINNPVINNTDVLVVMSRPALEKYYERLHSDGMVLYDTTLVSLEEKHLNSFREKGIRAYGIDATPNAEIIGHMIVANIILLGALTSCDDTLSFETLQKAVLATVPPKTIKLNEDAYKRGFELGEALKK